METMFITTFGVVEPEVNLSSLTSMYQQPAETSVDFLKRFKIQEAKCKLSITEADAIVVAIKVLEHKQCAVCYYGRLNEQGWQLPTFA